MGVRTAPRPAMISYARQRKTQASRRLHAGGSEPPASCRRKRAAGFMPAEASRRLHAGGSEPPASCRGKRAAGFMPAEASRRLHAGGSEPPALCRRSGTEGIKRRDRLPATARITYASLVLGGTGVAFPAEREPSD